MTQLGDQLRALADQIDAAVPDTSTRWPAIPIEGSGASGHGIDGSTVGLRNMLAVKCDYYLRPEAYGMTLNQEGRLFRDAISKGYVEATPDGLGILLAYLGKGALGEDARPEHMTHYFKAFYDADRTTHGNDG